MKNYHIYCLLLIGCWTLSIASANTTATVEITGKLAPHSCSIEFSRSKAELGTVSPTQSGNVEAMEFSLGTLAIACSAPTLVSFKMTSTAPYALRGQADYTPLAGWTYVSSNTPLDGWLDILASTTTVNNASGQLNMAYTWLPDWLPLHKTNLVFPYLDGYTHSFADLNSLTPVPIKTATVDLNGRLSETKNVDFTKGEITVNRTLTFELIYL